LPVGERRHIRR